MKRILLPLIATSLAINGFSDETPPPKKRTGQSAFYGSRDATVLSMMGWGVALAVGIGAICSLMNDTTGTTH